MVENKQKVEEALRNKEIDLAIHSRWPFIGDFMKFLEEKGVLLELKQILGKQKRKMVQCHIFALIYIIKLIVGIPTMRGTEELLCDVATMNLLGFDVDTIKNGLCNRGDANQFGNDYKKKHSACHG